MAVNKPVVMGVAGLGGYAGSVIKRLRLDQESADPNVQLAAVCDPDLSRHQEMVDELAQEGVAIHDDYAKLLATPGLEAVWLPLPIHLHRSFTERALERGLAVMCEKPAAGCVDDVDAMIAARDRAGRPVAIGYQDIYDPAVLTLKRELSSGVIGRIRRASVSACWPRGSHYYQRAGWAGALKVDGVWVLDSPANNAMAHYLNLPLFLLGERDQSAAQPLSVEAELYRTKPIENYDTVCMRVTLKGDIAFIVLMTHACVESVGPIIELEGERGRVQVRRDEIEIVPAQGEARLISRGDGGTPQMPGRFRQLVRGEENESVAVATLETSRPQAVVTSGASEAAPVHDVPAEAVQELDRAELGQFRVIRGIEEVIEQCVAQGKLLHESGLVNWSRPAGRRELRGYAHFAGPADALVTPSGEEVDPQS